MYTVWNMYLINVYLKQFSTDEYEMSTSKLIFILI